MQFPKTRAPAFFVSYFSRVAAPQVLPSAKLPPEGRLFRAKHGSCGAATRYAEKIHKEGFPVRDRRIFCGAILFQNDKKYKTNLADEINSRQREKVRFGQ